MKLILEKLIPNKGFISFTIPFYYICTIIKFIKFIKHFTKIYFIWLKTQVIK